MHTNTLKCPEPPSWGTWSEWGDCSVTCDDGRQERMRECEDATCPLEGGECPGDDSQTKDCNLACCPGKIFSFKPKYFLIVQMNCCIVI